MGHEPVLIPDYTFFIQLGLFFASYFVMRRFLFTPYLELLKMRRERTSELRTAAIEAREHAIKLRLDYDSYMLVERKKIAAWADSERGKLAEEERRGVQAARGAAGEQLHLVRANIAADVEQARQLLLPQIAEYAGQIVSKILGRRVQVNNAPLDTAKGSSKETVVPG